MKAKEQRRRKRVGLPLLLFLTYSDGTSETEAPQDMKDMKDMKDGKTHRTGALQAPPTSAQLLPNLHVGTIQTALIAMET